ncbi:MAG: glycyl-radical enzyme activating protein [Clostridium sp.]|uniref:glycyl-radical enzyme activating protein n=1 Tax=Clostridium sp. TaxID=1506 RepID=UPI0025C0E470|nr:glycyl-radical enzyme activating protein [Clostridium sp.]MCH3963906.1 glycyl-radical enzyme activating protein [Clostridium sp.]MCI1716107.1 glycyl-radical enzyme activating protein [Clostridium sp.]MCI1800653.1 glycyl-radical enzyme activating protein [Clostridium sp.]MCI1814284.1 glycyl-radical enzyme activating protein [Clostridium sp.]MCI1871183.1 glycyl-radical enzyme activating protein [Clostridium sp.]
MPYIFNIQKFSVHDGPGVRTTVFFKGCPIKCMWCHNPESQRYEPELMKNKDGKEEMIGRQYAIKELVKIVQADQIFYDQSGGGVTLSGGEVMTQDMDYVEKLARELQRVGISVAIDTCGVVPPDNYKRILPYTDLFLYDLKLIDPQMHKKYTGVSNDLILENLKLISSHEGKINLRLILINDVNADDESICGISSWLEEQNISIESINLLPYHDFGRDKYHNLNRECTQNFKKPGDERINEIKQYFEKAGYAVKIGG